MDMTGEYRIPAPRDVVWAGLNDVDILKAAIPGCEELIQHSPTELEAKVTAKVGPVKARFTGQVNLEDLNPPESYTLRGEGKGGPAGFAKGGARVHLTADGDATVMRYEAHADVGGKLAQLGSRLLQGTAQKMADDFFAKFVAEVTARHGGPVPAAEPSAAETAPAAPPRAAPAVAAAAETARRVTGEVPAKPVWQRPIVWVLVAAAVIALLLLS